MTIGKKYPIFNIGIKKLKVGRASLGTLNSTKRIKRKLTNFWIPFSKQVGQAKTFIYSGNITNQSFLTDQISKDISSLIGVPTTDV